MPFCDACLDMYVRQAIELRVLLLLGRVALGAQRPIVIKLSRVRSVGRSVCRSVCLTVQCIVEKRQIAAGSRLAP